MDINATNLDLAFKGFKTVYNTAYDKAPSFKDQLAMTVSSVTSEETYGWLGQFPEIREWIDERFIKEMAKHGFTIKNKKFESTVKVKRDDIDDDKLGLYKPMFSEMGRNTRQHPDFMLFGLLKRGFETLCFDGQNFFDAEHPSSMNAADADAESVSNMQAGDGAPWFLIDATREVKPIIWQERQGYELQSITDPNDTRVFMRDEFLYGIRARVNCGFGLWQLAFGSKAELNAGNYADARAAMMQYKGDTGQVLGVTPSHLVVPPSLEKQARALILADTDNGTSNIWKNSVEIIVSPFVA